MPVIPSGTAESPVFAKLVPEGGAPDRELVVTTYAVKNAFAGASIGDTITATQIIDVSGTPSTVSTIWRNQSTAADLAGAPLASDLELVGSQALTDAQLRALPINIKYSAATPTNISGTISVGGVSQLLLAASATLKGYEVGNPNGESIWINETGAATMNYQSREIEPGALWICQPHLVPNTAINIIGSTAGLQFFARAYQ